MNAEMSKLTKAAKNYECWHCHQPIPKGTEYIKDKDFWAIADTLRAAVFRYHPKCWEESK